MMVQLGHVDLVVTACHEGLLAGGIGQRRDSDNKKQRHTHLRFQTAIVNIPSSSALGALTPSAGPLLSRSFPPIIHSLALEALALLRRCPCGHTMGA